MEPTRRMMLAGATAIGLTSLAACTATRERATTTSTPPPRATPSGAVGARKGFNLSPRRADYTGGFTSPWSGLWANWDWSGKVQRDVDLGAGLGATIVRIIGAPQAVLTGLVTQQVYFQRLQQVLDHCDRKHLQLYPAGGTLRGWSQADLPSAQIQDLFVAEAAILQERADTVFGFDLINELVNSYDQFDPVALRSEVAGWARAVKAVAPSVRLTVSNMSRNPDWGYTSFPELEPALDFFDFHLLNRMPVDAVQAWRAHKPVVIGEVDVRRTAPDRAQEYRSIVRAAVRGGAEAVFAWDITSNDFGLYDSAGQNLDPGLAAGFASISTAKRG